MGEFDWALPEEAPCARPSSNFYRSATIVGRAKSTSSALEEVGRGACSSRLFWKRLEEPNRTGSGVSTYKCETTKGEATLKQMMLILCIDTKRDVEVVLNNMHCSNLGSHRYIVVRCMTTRHITASLISSDMSTSNFYFILVKLKTGPANPSIKKLISLA